MPNFPKKEELERIVHVTAPLQVRWDGKDLDMTKGVDVPYGIVYHFQELNPDVLFVVNEVTPKEIAGREIINPLEENGRGTAFAGLTKRKPRGDRGGEL